MFRIRGTGQTRQAGPEDGRDHVYAKAILNVAMNEGMNQELIVTAGEKVLLQSNPDRDLVDSGDLGRRYSKLSLVAQCVVVTTAYLIFYSPRLTELVAEWYNSSVYSYGALVPVAACYLVWLKIPYLKISPIASTLWGCVSLTGAVGFYVAGDVLGDSFATGISMVLTLAALTQMIFGARVVRVLAFPLFYLLWMIPIPYVFVAEVINWLIFFDATEAARIVQLLGVPIFLDSTFLHLPNVVLEVADVCSGITSVLALTVLSLIYAYLLPVGPINKVLVVFCSVPIAILANLFRIIVTILLTYWFGPAMLQSFFHTFHGTFNFALSLLALGLVGESIRRRFTIESAYLMNQMVPHGDTKAGWIGAGASLVIFSAASLVTQPLNIGSVSTRDIHLKKFPASFAGYEIKPTKWDDPYEDANANQSLARIYSNFYDSTNTIELFVGYKPNTRGGSRLQSPKLILPSKWSYVWVRPEQIDLGQGTKLKAKWMLTRRGNDKRLVLYWYQCAGHSFNSELWYRWELLKHQIMNFNSGIAVVRIAMAITEDEALETAKERLRIFASQLYPEIGVIISF